MIHTQTKLEWCGPNSAESSEVETQLNCLVQEIRKCTACAHKLPLGPRPVLHVSPHARLLIAGQAPGTRVHETGISFNDASGDRLRGWLGMSRDVFYDSNRVAILPMALCYPGVLPKGGDRPPPPECANLWRERILALLPNLRLTLLVGSYAQNYVLGKAKYTSGQSIFRIFYRNISLCHTHHGAPGHGSVKLPCFRKRLFLPYGTKWPAHLLIKQT